MKCPEKKGLEQKCPRNKCSERNGLGKKWVGEETEMGWGRNVEDSSGKKWPTKN
jgi:hypothetical protein